MCLSNMWYCRVQSLTEKSGAMNLLPENIKVLYFASNCVEPYVEVGLLYVLKLLGEYTVLHIWGIGKLCFIMDLKICLF